MAITENGKTRVVRGGTFDLQRGWMIEVDFERERVYVDWDNGEAGWVHPDAIRNAEAADLSRRERRERGLS